MAEDSETGTSESQGRRALLKRLGVAAGALVWATPVVQTITTSAASAAQGNAYGHGDAKTYGTTTTRRATTTTRPTTTTTRRATTTTTRPTTTTTRRATTTTTRRATTTTTRPTTTTTRPTTTTTRPTTTTTRRATTTSTTAPTTTTTRAGGTDCDEESGSGAANNKYVVQYAPKVSGEKTGGCHDISHLDLIVRVSGTNYGVQWDPGAGWGPHSTSSQHCLAGQSWVRPPSGTNYGGYPNPTPVSGGSYQLTLPSGYTLVAGYSKAGQECQPAVSLGGSTYRFDKWCPPGSTTTTTRPTTTTSRPTTTTSRPTTTTSTTRPSTTTSTTRPTTTTSTTRPTTTTTRPTTTTTRPTSTTSTTRPTSTTSTTRPTSTTSTTRPTSTTSTTQPSTTTTRAGGGDDCEGSPQPGKDISHMDWIMCRGDKSGAKSGSTSCTDRYGIQYDFGAGWGIHPSGPTSSQHCLAGLSWRVPSSSFSFAGFGGAVSLGGGAYRITLPADVVVFEAYSKCGQICRAATNLGGNTWRFDPC